ncbi:hypothetical protein CDA63_04435 [Hymenobacter amundsenii]|uniref:Outer membrane protein beta-barrel domain-containing protein n=1 Tax=Hymenobacter amundsenii TaxID=2006685 RepID=A0A246FNJ4_9BACT|nr:hypothetical protein [Hymenobacter amundsenii]OWP64292.1 hypothetical protein CDA63_04435 [Hymenobacter amundsenii]
MRRALLTTWYKPHALLLALLALPLLAAAAPTDTDSVAVLNRRADRPTAPRRWYLPNHLTVQTGGGIGMLSIGTGLSLAHDRLDLDVLAGYVPRQHAGTTLSVVAAKAKYSPWKLPLAPRLALTPLSVGVYTSYTWGLRNPGKPGQYPDDYYWFSNTVRVGPVLGSGLSYVLPSTTAGHPHKLTAYYELATNDLYLISYAQNRRALSLPDIATLALGLKLTF